MPAALLCVTQSKLTKAEAAVQHAFAPAEHNLEFVTPDASGIAEANIGDM